MSEKKKGGEALTEIPLQILFGTPGVILRGWAISLMWSWFVMPVFGVGALSISNAIGLTFFVALVQPKPKVEEDDPELDTPLKRAAAMLVKSATWSLLLLGFGLLTRQFT